MYATITKALRRRSLARRLHSARLRGHGLHERRWDDPQAGVAGEIVAWSRSVLGSSRRPHGMALFDLSLSLRAPGQRPRTVSFSRLEPSSLWEPHGLPAALEDLLRPATAGSMVVAVSLFCWGDALYAALS
jgi:hypothetical protein